VPVHGNCSSRTDLPGKFPTPINWGHPLEEEGRRGQDETTLRPAESQSTIDDETVFTTADVHQADGRVIPALIDVSGGRPTGLTAFVRPDDGWTIQQKGKTFEWIAVVQEWLPPQDRSPTITFDTPGVFPIRVISRLPLASTGRQIVFSVRKDGVWEGG
jgi:hypothetical protein